MKEKVEVFAIIRVDQNMKEIENAVTVKEVLPTLEEAEREVSRLNELASGHDYYYFWQITRYFPEGKGNSNCSLG